MRWAAFAAIAVSRTTGSVARAGVKGNASAESAKCDEDPVAAVPAASSVMRSAEK
ncbi:MAG: hypothetical protein LT106_07520 [Burkholderiaceae bacterium]|nr:hypothetical protein [Burkholderiaceae bacterium]